ncbi:MAG: agmatine deiminase family protein [Gammaproteobacteria bacterium]|nr:agmatine deiminase family protein [Gammaproteobacteria bacterium]
MKPAQNSAAPRLPAEWEPQSALLLTWPRRGGRGNRLAGVEAALTQIASQGAADGLRLLVACAVGGGRERVRRLFAAAGIDATRTALYPAPANDIWARDHGPIAIYRGGAPVLLDFRFDGWGGRFPAQRDDALTARLHATGAFGATPLRRLSLVLEGGGIDTDGHGTLLAHRDWPLAGGRNPGLDRAGLERQLRQALGCRRFLWLRHGRLPKDDTDGHIDLTARFVSPGALAYTAGAALEAELARLRRPDGQRYDLAPLPMPRQTDGPASYANFLILNRRVLVPQYGQRDADRQALTALESCFPGRDCVGIDSRALIADGGALHCAAMHLPLGIVH